jgi:Rrf2 family nitric oxide-sensitive transcriptional repressor
MFSQTVEYALRAVVHLAAVAPEARTVEQISRVTKVRPAYLAKVIQQLVHAGVLRSQRGVGGGIALVKSPAELTILEVVSAVDPIKRIATCPLGLASHGVRLCPLHRRMDNALAAVEKAFRETTLAEVLAEPTESVPLCDFPAARPGGVALPLAPKGERGG